MTDPLCPRCQSLDLSVAKFRIENTRAGEDNSFPPLIDFAPSHYVLGTTAQLRDSADECNLCALIIDTVRGSKAALYMDDATCRLVWEIDGRTSARRHIGHEANRIRRLRVCWIDARLKSCEAYIILAAPSKYDKSDVDYPGVLNDETQFLGRRIGNLGIEDPFGETLNDPYFGVIDIENENLVTLPFRISYGLLCFEPYATVSYVWGTKQSRQHATRISTIQSRRKSGGLSAVIRQLPKALRGSIDLVRGLGIRYMWIDALCIVQDSSSHSWNLNARAMHLIYGNSTTTICAADGEDANTEGRIFFQCRSTGMSEDVFSDKDGKGWSLDLVRAPLQLLSQLKVRAFWFYAHCVTLYTARGLYEPFDILAAFGGTCRLMENTMQAPFVFGLPTSHFDLAILWQPVAKSERLNRATVSDDPKYKDMRFPSWSWCGWNHQGTTYDWEMVGGCFADVRTWILNHTWIDWYIRDGYGTLCRVWDRRCAKEDESDDGRWRGYKVTQASKQEHKPFDDKHNDKTTPTGGRDEEMTNRYLSRAKKRVCMDARYSAVVLTPANRQIANTIHTPKGVEEGVCSPSSSLPDQQFLQFFTWRASFHVASVAKSQYEPDQPLKEEREAEGEGPLCRCDIIDRHGDKCGSVVVDTEWLRGKEKAHETMFEFIAISDAKQFTQKEFPNWTYYISKERIESEWDLYYALLVELFPEEGIYRRVALGKVFKAAFTHSEDEWKEIILG
ncbi:HET domain-containing protein [Fusarium sp. LHS14.1]|nr:HET domain-containing protein [Fusarium sp. LHS14.1]